MVNDLDILIMLIPNPVSKPYINLRNNCITHEDYLQQASYRDRIFAVRAFDQVHLREVQDDAAARRRVYDVGAGLLDRVVTRVEWWVEGSRPLPDPGFTCCKYIHICTVYLP